MLGLTGLDVIGKGIVDLDGLEYAMNLQSLYAPSNQITDIQALSGLVNLQWIELQNNRITNISPLAKLTNLSVLYLIGNRINDMSPLAGLTHLIGLTLGGNQISDISPLSGLTSLQTLSLYDNQITDIEPLSGLKDLQAIYLSSNQITDIGPLSSLTNLRMINLASNRIVNLEALSGLTNLEQLELQCNRIPIADISPLGRLTNLSWLDLSYDQITDISPLSDLTNLQRLRLTNNQITDIQALSGLTKLQELWLYYNQISDIGPLSALTKLQELNLSGNWIWSIEPLSAMTNLALLDLGANPLNREAYDLYIPLIQANNRGITLYCDPCPTCYRLVISSTRGGSVTRPGEGSLGYDRGQTVELEAAPEANFHLTRWTGTAVDAGKVADPNSLRTTVTVDGDYTLKATFLSVLDILHVDDNTPSDPGPNDPNVGDPNEDGTAQHPFDSIQEAIDAARNAATVLVCDGTYRENLDLLGKSVAVEGLWLADAGGVTPPVLEGVGNGPVVQFVNGEDANCRLMGLVVTSAPGAKATAIACKDSSPTIAHCIIAGNRAPEAGAVMLFENSRGMLANCTIVGNIAYLPVLTCKDSPNLTVINSIVWGNTGQGIRAGSGKLPAVVYSDVQEVMVGTGNLSTDPLFADNGRWDDNGTPDDASDDVWVMGDYHLMSTNGRFSPADATWHVDTVYSPCIDAGDPSAACAAEPSPNDSRINMGAYGGTAEASKSYRGEP
jgi:internalin A